MGISTLKFIRSMFTDVSINSAAYFVLHTALFSRKECYGTRMWKDEGGGVFVF
jgi:hypothetical protein